MTVHAQSGRSGSGNGDAAPPAPPEAKRAGGGRPKAPPSGLCVRRRRPLDLAAKIGIYACTAGVIVLVAGIVLTIVIRGLPHISVGLLTTATNYLEHTVGILPSIIYTLYVVLLSLLLTIPIGVGGAIYINEYAKNKRLIRIIEFTTETLSGIPSIIFGVFGWVFFCIFLNFKVSLLSGALTLTLMTLPIIVRTTGEALKAVPVSYRDAALGLGAAKWTMIRTILLPSASRGIITAVILAIGRMIGESAALILVAGGSAMSMPRGNLFEQIMSSGSTLSVELYQYATTHGDNGTAFAIALVLLVIAVILNLTVKLVNRQLGKGGVK